jgi:O-antigen ligase
MDVLTSTGPWMYPLLGVGLCLLIAIVRAAITIYATDGESPGGGPHHSVIIWGVLGGVVGLLGTVIGFGRVAVGARAETGGERAELASMLAVMWDGVAVIVTPVTLGLWLFTLSLLAWLVLQFLYQRRARADSGM